MTVTIAWGLPVIQDLQAQASQEDMLGELAKTREATIDLGLQGAVRQVGISTPSGGLSIDPGTPFLVSLNQADPVGTDDDCRFLVTDWAAGGNAISVTEVNGAPCVAVVDATCGVGHCIVAETVALGVVTPRPVTMVGSTVTLTTGTFDLDEVWHLRIEDSLGATIWHAWFMGGERIAWDRNAPDGGVGAWIEHGAAFSYRGAQASVEAQPLIDEASFGEDDLFLRLPVYVGTERSVSGQASWTVTLRLDGHSQLVRTTDAPVHRMNFWFAGDDAEAWCESLRLRNAFVFDEVRYANDAALSQDCTADPAGIQYTNDPVSPTPFDVEILHARVQVDVGV